MDSLVEVLLIGRDVSRRFTQMDSSFPRKTTKFKEFQELEIRNHLEADFYIVDKPVLYGASSIQGRFKNFTNSEGGGYAEIYFNADLNPCWRRFVYTKELCHLSNYGDQPRRASSNDDVNYLITKLISGVSIADLNSSTAVSSDFAAILIALEILLPYSEKDTVDKLLETQSKKEVARKYLIPAGVIFSDVFMLRLAAKIEASGCLPA